MIFNNKNTKVGLEFEFQLVTEIEGELQTVYVFGINLINYKLKITQINFDLYYGERPLIKLSDSNEKIKYCHSYLDNNIKLDMGNIEISTDVFLDYNKALNQVENLFKNKLIKILKQQFNKFALFLPTVFCKIGKMYAPNKVYTGTINYSSSLGGNKHINLDFSNELFKHLIALNYPIMKKYRPINGIYDDPLEGGYYHTIEIKIPYHFSPSENINEWPDYNKIIIPPDKWRPLVGYYKNNKWHQIRKLI